MQRTASTLREARARRPRGDHGARLHEPERLCGSPVSPFVLAKQVLRFPGRFGLLSLVSHAMVRCSSHDGCGSLRSTYPWTVRHVGVQHVGRAVKRGA